MPCHMSILNLLVILFFSVAGVLRADIGVTAIRLPGAALDPSLKNEADRAVRQSAIWLAKCQNIDGSWGISNRIRLTSLALLALNASSQSGYSDGITRATLWLDTHITNRVVDLDTHAWRLLALTQVLPDNATRLAVLRRFSDAGQPFEAKAPTDTCRLWHEALTAAGLKTTPIPTHAAPDNLARLAYVWPPTKANTANIWQLAHLINREGNGQLMRGNIPLDWRRDLAQQLINTQRNASSGGGYWDAPDTETIIVETAFGLLSLLEL